MWTSAVHDVGQRISATEAQSGGVRQDVRQRELRRSIAAAAMGNATEWYDYGAYAATTGYLTHAFFPTTGVALTMLGYAVSFLLRPLGGFVWGPLGDRVGRRTVMAITVVLMSMATAAIAVVPTYGSIGVLAPVILIGLRVVQGFCTGGEYGGAATYMAETAPADRRGRYGSFLEVGTLAGFLGGATLVLLGDLVLSAEAMQAWGWRVIFAIALPLGAVGWYLRHRLSEPPIFERVQNQPEMAASAPERLRRLLSDYRKPIVVMMGLVIALNIANYTLISYQPTYLKGRLGLTETQAQTVILVGEAVMMCCLPLFGALSDRVGRKPLWWTSLIGLFVFALPMYWLMGHGIGWAIIGFVVLGMLHVPQLATISATFPAMFPTPVRYAGFAVAYNTATAAFGGTAPLINDRAIEATGWPLFPAAYLMVACAIGMVALPHLIETTQVSIAGTGIPGADD